MCFIINNNYLQINETNINFVKFFYKYTYNKQNCIPIKFTCPLNPLPSSDLINSAYVEFAALIVRDTASWYSGETLASKGIAPIGTESWVMCGTSLLDGETSKLYGLKLKLMYIIFKKW